MGKNHFAAGVSTTSRVEGLHKVLSDHLNSNSRLMEVLEAFQKIEENHTKFIKEELNRHSKNISNNISSTDLFKELSKIYSPYVLQRVEQKISKALSYKHQELIPNEKW